MSENQEKRLRILARLLTEDNITMEEYMILCEPEIEVIYKEPDVTNDYTVPFPTPVYSYTEVK